MSARCESELNVADGDANLWLQCEKHAGHEGCHMYIFTWEGCGACFEGRYGHAKHPGGAARHPGIDDQGRRIPEAWP